MAQNQEILAQLISHMLNFGRVIKSRMSSENKTNFATVAQFEALAHINHKETLPMKDLADYLMIAPASATSIVEKLLDQKLIERVHDKKDRRQINIKISAKGKKVVKKNFSHAHKKIAGIFSKLEIKSQKQLIRILDELQKAHRVDGKTKNVCKNH